MNELVIKTHDFEVAKQGLKEFSEQTITELDLKRVDTSKDVGEWLEEWFKGGGIGTDHKVTGAELNRLITQIQEHLIGINAIQKKFIQEFGQVYNALEALDKDYIQAFLVSIKATEITSQGISDTQKEIKQIVDDQRKTLEVLKKFKQKLDSYAHLGEIDALWNNFKKQNNRMEEHERCLKQQVSQMESVRSFIGTLEKAVHLEDIDRIWDSSEQHTIQLSELEKNSKKTANFIEDNRELVDATIPHMTNKIDSAVQAMTKKVNYAYLLAGGSLGLALIELIVIILKVL